jgi:hypothetical protein
MFKVELRYSGEVGWRTSAPALTLQAAFAQASLLSNSRIADHARVARSGEPARLVDRRV